MDLIAADPFQLVCVERRAECLLADQRPVRHFLLAGLEPRQHLRFEEAEQGIGVGGGRLVLLQFGWLAYPPPFSV
jgi:hypothetical protein